MRAGVLVSMIVPVVVLAAAAQTPTAPWFLDPPLLPGIYTADPSAHVFGGRIYIYPSHDIDAGVPADDMGSHFAMRDYHVLSMDRIGGAVKDHGVALDIGSVREWTFNDNGLLNGTAYSYTARVVNAAGTEGPQSNPYVIHIDTQAPTDTVLKINDVTLDNIVNKTEAAGNVTISGSVEGEYTPGNQVTFTLNGTAYTAFVGANRLWSVTVEGSDLKNEGDLTALTLGVRYTLEFSNRADVALVLEGSQVTNTVNADTINNMKPKGTTVLAGIDFAF